MIHSAVKLKAGGSEEITAYKWDEGALPPERFNKKWKNKKVIQWARNFGCFDSETSHNHDLDDPKGWVYQWAFLFDGVYFYGRTPEEFLFLLRRIKEQYDLNTSRKMIFYIHNLAYDGQYLKHYLRRYDPALKIFSTDKHAYLYIDMVGFRLYCSYRLTGLSLNALSSFYSNKYVKAVGEIDYTKIRYQDSDLDSTDWHYMFSDVASQHDGITSYLKAQGYEYAYDAPITSTGFVRTDCRKESLLHPKWRDEFERSALTKDQYPLFRQGFMGGITICSYLYTGQTVRGSLGHVDFTSSYPARQMMDYFPEGKFVPYGAVDSRKELEALTNKYCCMFLLTLTGVQIKAGVTAPYIPSSKCIELIEGLKLNGKIVSADRLTMAVTEIDYQIIRRQYNALGIKVDMMQIAKRGHIPEWLKKKIMEYYKHKCTLKHTDPLLYMASKAKLNGIYGMSATALVRDLYDLDDDMIMQPKHADLEKELNKYYRSRNSFLPYQYGCWTTAHARKALIDLIEAIGYDKFLYCDTDSVFYLKDDDTEKAIASYNAGIRKRAIAAGAYIGDDILGIATEEPEITAFRGLHAKCYAMIEEGKLKVTIAGIPKKSIKWIHGKPVEKSNAEELADIDNLNDGFIFRHNGGTRSIYVEQEPAEEEINGHKTSFASSCIIDNIEKEISNTMWTVGKDYSVLKVEQSYI